MSGRSETVETPVVSHAIPPPLAPPPTLVLAPISEPVLVPPLPQSTITPLSPIVVLPPNETVITSSSPATPSPTNATPLVPSSIPSTNSSALTERVQKHAGKRSSVLIIYTGGTIGMKRSSDGTLSPSSGYLLSTLRMMPELSHEDMPRFDIHEWETPMDSSDFSPECWIEIARHIERYYFDYDGFVILHGTDTLAYTASALSFMLDNLAKTVVLTGSMIPLSAPVSDAKRNLIISLLCAVNLDVPEICVFFNNLLLRGNRARKVDPTAVHAFDSPNCPPLAIMGTRISLARELVLPAPRRKFCIHTKLHTRIACLILTPAFDDRIITSYLSTSTPQDPVALVLQLYGTGNAPAHRSTFIEAMKQTRKGGAAVVITSQCLRGSVDMLQYATGSRLLEYGVIDGRDMTVEACVAKLAWLMGSGLRGAALKLAMESNLKGELTLKSAQDYNINQNSDWEAAVTSRYREIESVDGSYPVGTVPPPVLTNVAPLSKL